MTFRTFPSTVLINILSWCQNVQNRFVWLHNQWYLVCNLFQTVRSTSLQRCFNYFLATFFGSYHLFQTVRSTSLQRCFNYFLATFFGSYRWGNGIDGEMESFTLRNKLKHSTSLFLCDYCPKDVVWKMLGTFIFQIISCVVFQTFFRFCKTEAVIYVR